MQLGADFKYRRMSKRGEVSVTNGLALTRLGLEYYRHLAQDVYPVKKTVLNHKKNRYSQIETFAKLCFTLIFTTNRKNNAMIFIYFQNSKN